MVIIALTFATYNFRNIQRIHKEINIYKYNLAKSPLFYVKEFKSKISFEDEEFKIYSPPPNEMCWASKTPCTHRKGFFVKSFLGTKIVIRE